MSHVPVSLDELLRLPQGLRAPVPDSLPDLALRFLREHPKEAWRAMEIAAALSVEQTTLSPALTRLRRKGLVENKDGYWYALSDKEVAKRVGMMMTTRLANEKWGAENPNDWPTVARD